MQLKAPSFFYSTVLSIIYLVAVVLVCNVVWSANSVWDSNAVTVSSLCNLGQCTNHRFDNLSKFQRASEYLNSWGVFLLAVGMLGVLPLRQIPFQVLCHSMQKNDTSKNEALTTPKEKLPKIHEL